MICCRPKKIPIGMMAVLLGGPGDGSFFWLHPEGVPDEIPSFFVFQNPLNNLAEQYDLFEIDGFAAVYHYKTT